MLIDLNDALDHLLALDDPDDAPTIEVEVEDVQWQRAEPDVGIMSDYADDWRERYYVGRIEVGDADCFASMLVSLSPRPYGDNAEAIAKAVRGHVEERVRELEPGA